MGSLSQPKREKIDVFAHFIQIVCTTFLAWLLGPHLSLQFEAVGYCCDAEGGCAQTGAGGITHMAEVLWPAETFALSSFFIYHVIQSIPLFPRAPSRPTVAYQAITPPAAAAEHERVWERTAVTYCL